MNTPKDFKTSLKQVLFILAVIACTTPWVNSPMALIGGFLFAYFLGNPFQEFSPKATKLLLKVAVVGLGFGMNFQQALSAGKDGFMLTIASISTILILGFLIGKWMKIDKKLAHLVSSGTAICGGSAIAAVAPVINASEKEISVALGTVFLLNSVALLIFPPIGSLLEMSQQQFGLWSAIAIHDTSSVVGAAATYGEEALKIATTVKLARALWIIPLAFLTAFLFKNSNKKIKIPYFIGYFVLAMLANTYVPFLEPISQPIVTVAKGALVATLFLIGAGLSIENLKKVGWKPLALGVILWAFISVAALGAVFML